MQQNGRRTLDMRIAIATTTLLLTVSAALPLHALAMGLAQTPVPTEPSPESPCTVQLERSALPQVLLLGETVELRMRVRVDCPAPPPTPMHVVLVLDASGSMQWDGRSAQLKAAARELVRGLDLPSDPTLRVGIVAFASTAQTLCRLTHDGAEAIDCIDAIGADGGSAIDRGIQEGLKVMRQGRNRVPGLVVNEILVLLSDGANTAGCEPVERAARQAQSMGILVITVCVGSDCDAACLREVASSARYYYRVEEVGALVELFEGIRNELVGISLGQLTVVDFLASSMAYVAGSAQPPAIVSADRTTLEWQRRFLPRDGLTFTYRLRPRAPGFHATTDSSTAVYRDHHGHTSTDQAAGPWVNVFAPRALPPRP